MARQSARLLLLLKESGYPGLVVALTELALVTIVLVALFQYQGSIVERGETRNALEAVDATLIALTVAESGVHGYVISSDPKFLTPYRNSLESIDQLVASLGTFAARDRIEEAAYETMLPIVQEKLTVMENSVALTAAGQAEAARALIATGEGRQLTDAIRAQLGIIRSGEEGRLQARTDRVDNIGRFIAFATIVLSVVTLAVVGWLLLTLRKQHDVAALRSVAIAKDEFVGFVSHELRTPITLISGHARLLQDETDSTNNPARADALEEIIYASERMQDIVETLMNLAKAESGTALNVEPILLARIAETVRRHHLRQNPGKQVDIFASEETPPALGDRGAVEQVLINLLSNAMKYGDAHSPIAIEVAPDGPSVRVSVINSGMPLDRDALEHVFEPFFRMPASATSARGIGLGLTVCHRLIAAQGGQMSAEAILTGGARFTFRLPAVDMETDI